ncbi:MAG: hypothetical protein R3C02_24210 [Planctomycetaceae bacterium]
MFVTGNPDLLSLDLGGLFVFVNPFSYSANSSTRDDRGGRHIEHQSLSGQLSSERTPDVTQGRALLLHHGFQLSKCP